MSQEIKSCPFCGSYNLQKNTCQDCKRNVNESKYSQIREFESSKGKKLRFTIPQTNIGPGTYEIKRDEVFDSTGNRICSKKRFGIFDLYRGNIQLKTGLGYLKLDKEKPDKIGLFDLNDVKMGELLLKEKDEFVLEVENNFYKLDLLGTYPLKVVDKTNDSLITIEEIPGGATTRLGISIPSYRFHTNGKLKLEIVILIAMFVSNYNSFFYGIKPTSNYTFTVKRPMGLKFYDSQGQLYAKTTGVNKIWWIIGFLTFLFLIGFIIIFYLGYKSKTTGTIVLVRTGEKIGSFKGNFGFSKIKFNVPSLNWSGNIDFKNFYLARNLISVNDTISTNEGNYNLKLLTIVENKQKEKMFTVYGFANNFVIRKNERFNDYKTLILASIIIKRYLIPQNSG